MLIGSYPHSAQARYLNYDKIIAVTSKLQTLQRNPELATKCKKEFEQKYTRLLRPSEYNKLYALLLQLLDTSDHKPLNQQENALQILEMVSDEIKGLINKHGYRPELINLSYRTTLLTFQIHHRSSMNPFHTSAVKRSVQDLLSEAILTDMIFERIQTNVKKHVEKQEEQKRQEKDQENQKDTKESQSRSENEKPDMKRE
jgi:hypothetical protein